MAKVLLACFSPFNSRVSPISSHSTLSDASESAALLASLILDLQVLEKSLENEPISLKWCSEAMFLIKTMHSHFLLFFFEKISQVSGSWDRAEAMEEYLKESLDLLDLCNILKSAISRIDRQRLAADLTVRRSNDGPKTVRVQKWKEEALCKVGSTNVVQNTIATLSLLVFSTVLESGPVKIGQAYTKAGQSSFLGRVWRLVGRFTERFEAAQEGGKEVLKEIADFQARLSDEAMETVKGSSEVLKEGLELFETVVDEVFDDVIEGRKKVLDLITSNSTSLAKDCL